MNLKSNLKGSNIIGSMIGFILGMSEGSQLGSIENWPFSTAEEMYVILIFAVVAPCLSTVANTVVFRNIFKFMERINSFIGFYALMVLFFFTSSIYGFLIMLSSDSGVDLVSSSSLFFAAGIGFFLAYWLDKKFGYWYMKNA